LFRSDRPTGELTLNDLTNFCISDYVLVLQRHMAPAILSPIVQKSTNGNPQAAEPYFFRFRSLL
jgi:hypothetical protein